MRLFVAVLPPVEALQGLYDAVEPVRGLPGADRLRWTTVEGWHLTLAFLGEVPAERLPELEAGLAGVAEVHAVHRLRIAGAGRFGDRVLWAGVEGQTWALRRLAEAVNEATADVIGEVDAFTFHPHLTLARAGSSRGHRRAVQRMAAAELDSLALALGDYRGPEWEAAELHLMKSEPDGGVTHYETVRAWPLADWS
ncbi:RNA 2',3'-cyclic phosphodiesterase [Streptomyces sp. CB01881]|uniref:RNA 2',3'-cyclic phosphodiesterase n=1 Tax=Streptomyces sp. CB01881 TaxID=2078691 RepID=UPI000CDBCCCC|nr:RNA 2',3'-cyclic phosphodiesterase [Streptomyces sp. CB01881]AUY50231.1 RNA 2',3'-cyclic phosphodiesterase [Streptomyces sp. CB01881]TYC73621.1 RNA 2',3'-cyclic phosphodiesterase [Streptomyces sp. CB01881]